MTAKSATTIKQPSIQRERSGSNWRRQGVGVLVLMLVPAMIFLIVFHYLPMFGAVIAFMDFNPLLGFFKSTWVGLQNYETLFMLPDLREIMRNTIVISVGKILIGQVVTILFALLLNELHARVGWFKRIVQTFAYIPNFISWVIIGGIMMDVLSTGGILNQGLRLVGIERPPGWLSEASVFPWTLILSDVWKGFGWGAVIYLAAISNLSVEMFEAATVDGANRFQKMWYLTLPGIAPFIMLNFILSLGNILNAGLDQVLMLINPAVYSTGDVLDTYVYRVGIQSANWSFGQAVALLKSGVSFVLIMVSWFLANRYSGYRPF